MILPAVYFGISIISGVFGLYLATTGRLGPAIVFAFITCTLLSLGNVLLTKHRNKEGE